MKIVAMVRFNRRWAYVFDTPIRPRYREEVIDGKRYLIGRDGPFVDCLAYQQDRWAKAFAGRELTLQMEDGTERKIKDVWWQTSSPFPTVSITCATVQQLRECYVFSGCECDAEALQQLVGEYEDREGPKPFRFPSGGYRYPYWEYEKVINYDSMRADLLARIRRLEGERKSLIKEARRQKSLRLSAATREE